MNLKKKVYLTTDDKNFFVIVGVLVWLLYGHKRPQILNCVKQGFDTIPVKLGKGKFLSTCSSPPEHSLPFY